MAVKRWPEKLKLFLQMFVSHLMSTEIAILPVSADKEWLEQIFIDFLDYIILFHGSNSNSSSSSRISLFSTFTLSGQVSLMTSRNFSQELYSCRFSGE